MKRTKLNRGTSILKSKTKLRKNEQWFEVKGFGGLYQVSDLGNVKSFNHCINSEGRLLTPSLNKARGYYYVTLQYGGIRRNYALHRLVAETVILNPKNLPQVNHIDGNKSNNKVSNLEWVSISGNIKHAFDNGLRKHPIGKRKINEEIVIEIRNLKKQQPELMHKEIAKQYGLGTSTITHILLGTRWGHI